MRTKLSRIHHLLQPCLWVCLCIVCSAYTTAFSLDSWLSEFVQLRVEQKDSAMPLMKITEHYRSLNKSGQKEIKDKLTLATSSYLTQNKQEEALAVIDLYNYMVEEKDDSWSRLNFVKGNIAAERNDTLTLKRIISQLESIEGDTYATQLTKLLLEIRHFVPADKGLSGWWMSDKLFSTKYSTSTIHDNRFRNVPKYILYWGEQGNTTCVALRMESLFSINRAVSYSYDWNSQIVKPYTKDSIYVVWSSEVLDKGMDANTTTLLRDATNELSSTAKGYFSQRNKFDSSTQMLSGVLTGIVEVGLNMLWDNLSEPKKDVAVMETRLKRISDYELQGVITYHFTRMKASDTNFVTHVETDTVTFYKVFPENKIAFMTICDWVHSDDNSFGKGNPIMKVRGDLPKRALKGYPYPYDAAKGSLKKHKKKREKGKVTGLHWKEVRDDTTTYYGKAWLQYKSLKKNKERRAFLEQFNAGQMERIKQYAREQARLKKEKEEE